MTILRFFYDVFFWFFPINHDLIFINCFNGQYNDNPKYIANQIHCRYPEKQIALVISDAHGDDVIPSYFKIVELFSKDFYRYKRTARVVIDNYTGFYGCEICTRGCYFKRIVSFFKISLMREKQFNISTWHGTPLKHIGLDKLSETEKKKYKYVNTTNILIAGSNYEASIFQSAFNIKAEVLGNARNDILFSNGISKALLKEKIGLPIEKKILLFAPTYRSNFAEAGLDYLKDINFNKVRYELSKVFGGEWVVVLRLHQNTMRWMMSNYIKNEYGEFIDGNKFDDMAEYLFSCDALITDYSGSLFDVSLTEIPCFLYTPDLYKYRQERGLYLDVSDLPYDYALNGNQLIDNIRNYDQKAHLTKIKTFNHKIGNMNDGHSAERIVNFLHTYIVS